MTELEAVYIDKFNPVFNKKKPFKGIYNTATTDVINNINNDVVLNKDNSKIYIEKFKDLINLKRCEASDYLKIAYGITCATSTLAKLASIGGGPSYYKAGSKPLYPKAKLDEWAADKIGSLKRNSSDVG